MPSGMENRIVRKKIAHVRSMPTPMDESIVEKLMIILLKKLNPATGAERLPPRIQNVYDAIGYFLSMISD